MSGEDALRILETASTLPEEQAAMEAAVSAADKPLSSSAPGPAFEGWALAELPISTGLPRPLLAAVPPCAQPRMAACGWLDLDAANALETALLIFKGVSSFPDFAVGAAATSDIVKGVSSHAAAISLSEGMQGKEALAL